MTGAVVAVRPRALTLGRTAAVLAAASAAVHLLQVSGASLGSLVMAAMALACLPCAWHLWRSPTPSVWGTTAALDAAMLLVHATLMAGTPHAHHVVGAGGAMWLGTTLVVGQLVLAASALLRR